MNITGSDSVIAHFIQHTVSIPVLEQNNFTAQVYPTITNGITNIEFYLPQIEDIQIKINSISGRLIWSTTKHNLNPVSYTHLRAHETVLDLVCRLLLEKKKKTKHYIYLCIINIDKNTI